MTRLEKDLAGTLAVTPGQIVYVKLCGDLGWAIAAWWLLAHVQGHELLLPSDARAENAGGDLHARLLPAENVKGPACGPGTGGAEGSSHPFAGSSVVARAGQDRFEPGYEGVGCLQLEVRDLVCHSRGLHQHSPLCRRCHSATI